MTRYKFKLIDTSNPTDVEMFEDLKTKALEDDTIQVLVQETTFTKEGNYLIAIQWTEDDATEADRQHLRKMVEDLS